MNKLLAVCLIVLSAGFPSVGSAQEKQSLRLVQAIPLPGVKGRLDHMGTTLEKNRLFVGDVANNSLGVVDRLAGRESRWFQGSRRTRCSLAATSTNCMYQALTGM